MPKPTSFEQFQARFHANQEITGYGVDVATHMPCGFCAAPEWLVVKVIDFEHRAMTKGAVCKECGRGIRAIIKRDHIMNLRFELVQFCGDDPPEWLPKPWPRRVER